MNPDTVRTQAFAHRHQVGAFRKMAALADKAGVDIFVVGGAAAGYVNRIRLSLRKKSNPPIPRSNLRLDKMFNPLGIDVDVVVRNKDGKAMTWKAASAFRAQLVRAIPYLAFDVQPFDGTDRLPGFTSKAYLGTHHDTTDFMLVHLNTERSDRFIRDARQWDTPEATPPCLRELVSGRIRLYMSDAPKLTKKRSRPRGEMRAIFRVLTKALRYDLEISSDSVARINDSVGRFDPAAIDKHTNRWLAANAKKLFDPTNLTRRPLKVLASFGVPNDATLLAKLTDAKVGGIDNGIKALQQNQRPVELSNAELITTVLNVERFTDLRILGRDGGAMARQQAYFFKLLQTRALTKQDRALFRRLAKRRLALMTEDNATETKKAILGCGELVKSFPDLSEALANVR